MSMPISHPWLAPRSRRIARNGGGNTDVGRSVPPPGAWRGRRGGASDRSVARRRWSRMLLKARRVADAEIARRFVPRVACADAVRDDSGEAAGA